MPQPSYRRKLIEVDLPLDEINAESKREKSIRHGHPSTLHLWWARRPLAACRAVIFASMVDDPSAVPEEFPTEAEQHEERERLHDLIKQLVIWENTTNEQLIDQARYEIARSVARSRNETAPTVPADVLKYLGDKALPIYDPFAGGGSIPLEAQRLGLKAVASDLNPVAVVINKALIELPPKFADQPPVNPDADPLGMTVGKGRRAKKVAWQGAAGLADDIRYYGKWMRERAHERIGHLFPKAKLIDGTEATVIAWLWARTIRCPNPTCGIALPLLRTFQVSTRAGNRQWARPMPRRDEGDVSFDLQDHTEGVPDSGTVGRQGARCVACHTAVPLTYVREEASAGRMSQQMVAIVADGGNQRVFLAPNDVHIETALSATPTWKPAGDLPERALGFRVQAYGVRHWHEPFTERQLMTLTTLCDLVRQARDALVAHGASASYADAVTTYLALAIGRDANMASSFSVWHNAGHFVSGVFGRQAIPMVWDFPEKNCFSDASGNWSAQVEWVAKVLERLPTQSNVGVVHQADATTVIHTDSGPVIVTDPPYYDNIGYADLSDFFYAWMRPILRETYPDLFAGISTPKREEMIATPFRSNEPRRHFEDKLGPVHIGA